MLCIYFCYAYLWSSYQRVQSVRVRLPCDPAEANRKEMASEVVRWSGWLCQTWSLQMLGDWSGQRSSARSERFQLEFCFRDAKHYAGLNDCQSTDLRKLEFHSNASFAIINIATVALISTPQDRWGRHRWRWNRKEWSPLRVHLCGRGRLCG